MSFTIPRKILIIKTFSWVPIYTELYSLYMSELLQEKVVKLEKMCPLQDCVKSSFLYFKFQIVGTIRRCEINHDTCGYLLNRPSPNQLNVARHSLPTIIFYTFGLLKRQNQNALYTRGKTLPVVFSQRSPNAVLFSLSNCAERKNATPTSKLT